MVYPPLSPIPNGGLFGQLSEGKGSFDDLMNRNKRHKFLDSVTSLGESNSDKEKHLITKNCGPSEEAKVSDEDSDSDSKYEVKEVVGCETRGGLNYYLLKYVGYDDNEPEWEPEFHLECDELIRQYHEGVAINNSKPNSVKISCPRISKIKSEKISVPVSKTKNSVSSVSKFTKNKHGKGKAKRYRRG